MTTSIWFLKLKPRLLFTDSSYLLFINNLSQWQLLFDFIKIKVVPHFANASWELAKSINLGDLQTKRGVKIIYLGLSVNSVSCFRLSPTALILTWSQCHAAPRRNCPACRSCTSTSHPTLCSRSTKTWLSKAVDANNKLYNKNRQAHFLWPLNVCVND